MLLDEPTSHLDFGNQTRVLALVEKLAATGLPIVMTSHFPDHVFMVANRVAIMKDGWFLGFGSPDGAITGANLERAYGIKVKIINLDAGINRKICVPLGT